MESGEVKSEVKMNLKMERLCKHKALSEAGGKILSL